jgi:Mn-dependent DtxR family transcriptional regulator
MPRTKGNNDILSLLSPARRREVLDEALGERVRAILGRHQRSDFGRLVTALQRDARWDLLRTVSVASVLRAGGGGRVANGAVKRRGRRGSLDQGTLDQILKFVEKHPGLRSEQIQGELDVDRKLVKAGLAKLRETKKVRTSGHKRATTYTA